MSGSLPDRIDPLRLAASGQPVQGRLPLAKLTRLADSLHDTAGEVSAELRGTVDAQGVRGLHGRIATTLRLLCQRCLEPMDLPVALEFRLGLVISEQQAQRLPEDCEPLLLTEPTVSVAAIIEDELILALPIVALHPEGSACAARAAQQAQPEAPGAETRKQPFAVLSQLKNSH